MTYRSDNMCRLWLDDRFLWDELAIRIILGLGDDAIQVLAFGVSFSTGFQLLEESSDF